MTGVPAEDIAQAARWYARPPFAGSCLVWGMGITQHTNGIHNAHSLLNLSLVAGQLGFPGSGISPLRGQNNVQGCGDAGCIPTNLPGYQSYAPETLARFEARWGIRPPGAPGRVVTEMVEGCLTGEIRAMYVVGENPLLSEPDLHHAEKAIGQLDFLVVQDLFLHETAERAHVFLPAAAFAEKEGTFTNSERRVQRVRKALEPPGQARPDWWIAAELAKRVAAPPRARRARPVRLRERRGDLRRDGELTPFLAGMSHARLDREGGLQWPCPGPDHPGTRFLYGESFPLGKARFVPAIQTVEAAELPDPDYPFVLNTGRLLYHWHGGTITRRVEGLLELAPRLEVAVHPSDARRLGIDTGSRIRVGSRRGELTGYARVTEAVRAGRCLRALRQARRLRRELPDQFRVRSLVQDPRVQGLRRPAGTAGGARRITPCRAAKGPRVASRPLPRGGTHGQRSGVEGSVAALGGDDWRERTEITKELPSARIRAMSASVVAQHNPGPPPPAGRSGARYTARGLAPPRRAALFRRTAPREEIPHGKE